MSNQATTQYPEPKLTELDRASLRDVINHSTGTARAAAEAELASRTDATATATVTITTAAELDDLPVHARVTDNKGVEWKKQYGPGFRSQGWSFRCLGGYNRDQQTSEFLAQYAPLTVLPDND